MINQAFLFYALLDCCPVLKRVCVRGHCSLKIETKTTVDVQIHFVCDFNHESKMLELCNLGRMVCDNKLVLCFDGWHLLQVLHMLYVGQTEC